MKDHQSNSKRYDLNRLLNMPQVPDTLAPLLRANLEQQLGKEKWKWRLRNLGRTALAASLLMIAILVLFKVNSIPPFVQAAYTHAQHEAELSGRFAHDYAEWLRQHAIQLPPDSLAVQLARHCYVDGYPSMHLRVASADIGYFNLFIHSGSGTNELNNTLDGEVRDQVWFALKPHGKMVALALFEPSVDRSKIVKILKTMFSEQTTKTS